MKFCQAHWDQLRAAIHHRGLAALIAESGEKAASNVASALTDGETIDNFDPLMSAHMAIWSNAMTIAETRYQANPMAMMADNPEHPEWSCPICFLNEAHSFHDANCTDVACDWPKGERYEWMIDRAADDQVAAWKAFNP